MAGTTASVTATDTGTGTINDDDSAAVTISDASANEGDDIAFTVTLDKAVPGGLTVTPGFTDETATEGADYIANSAAVTFTGTAGETQTFTVATADDTDDEANETFTVGLTVSGTTASVTATDTATGTIIDDDETPTPRSIRRTPVVTIEDASADEGEQITFTVTLDQELVGGLTVTPGFTDGTATEGTDYTANAVALSFTGTAGETQSFTVATIEDTESEADETFTVSLSVSGASETVTATDTGDGDHRRRRRPRRRRRRADDRGRRGRRGRRAHVHGDAGQSGAGWPQGDAFVHGRDRDEGRGLHREHGCADLHRDRGRDAELHGGDHRGHRGRGG